jgi:dTDP-4-dehydrorhamnose reductase
VRPILVTGGAGTLGRAFGRVCDARGLACRLTSRAELDIADAGAVASALALHAPWLVVNAAGYVRVDDAELDRDRCWRENALGPGTLARVCARARIPLVSFSSDLVFDGGKEAPYEEHDAPAPLGSYGRAKLEGERRILGAHPGALVIRTSAFFGPWDAYNFVTAVLRTLAGGGSVRAAADTTVSPTYVPDLVDAVLDLAIDGEHGVWHLANAGSTTWADLARAAARLAGAPAERVIAVARSELAWRAPRPAFSALASARGALLPARDDALRRYHTTRTPGPPPRAP